MTGYYRKMNGFLFISKYAGMREDLIQAGGGNTSYKESDEKMYIKASGVQLADITNIFSFPVPPIFYLYLLSLKMRLL